MKTQRHPHPHIDPRQPRQGARPGTNPPVFVWKPPKGAGPSRLVVARDAAFERVCLDESDLRDPLFLPETAFAPGRYFWKWSAGDCEGEVFSFETPKDSVVLEVPSVETWLERFPAGHPRIYIRPEEVEALRASRRGERAERWAKLQAEADAVLAERHEIEEPPYLPDRAADYEAFFRAFHDIMWRTRTFVRGAELLALAYLASGEPRYGRAACQRLDSLARWDPEGSSHLRHNDEAHMPIIWSGPTACDWAWDLFTDEERGRVVEHLRRRGQITFEHMHDRGCYGVTRFDSHAGREIVFLAQTAFLIHEHAPEARRWLEWLRPVLCGVWPVWAGDDGGWAEGVSYSLAYVSIMTLFATTLKRGAGVDLYSRPFWRGHARWRQWCLPPYAEWIGFGDHTERWANSWRANADLVEIIARETGADEFDAYIAAMRAEAETCAPRRVAQGPRTNPQLYLAPEKQATRAESPAGPTCRVFPAVGWAAVRTHLDDPAQDVALLFRSSPYGSISHSHANNNDFIIHVAGKVMAMPSGYYCGYGSPHHAHWVWHTKSHNCLTLSDAGQLMRSHDSVGRVENFYEDERLAYFLGVADASYADRAARCRRHVVFLKRARSFLLIDDFEARPGVVSALQWNIHSWAPFAVDEEQRSFVIEREGRTLTGYFLYHLEAFFSVTQGWDPPPLQVKSNDQWLMQHHLRFTPNVMAPRQRLGVVLAAGCERFPAAAVRTERNDGVEFARIGEDAVWLSQGGAIPCEGAAPNALAAVRADGALYQITDAGLAPVGGGV